MRAVLLAILVLASTAAQAQWQSVSTPAGPSCRHAPDGLTVPSGNFSDRFSLAVCNSWNHFPLASLTLAVDTGCAALATPLAAKVGSAFVSPPFGACFSGDGQPAALWSLERTDGDPQPFTVNALGVVSYSGSSPAGAGHVTLVRATAAGVAVRVPLPWTVTP